jgi:zinc protease
MSPHPQPTPRSLLAALAALTTLSLASAAIAQQNNLAAPLHLPTRTLDNGLTVLVIPDPSLPLVTVEIAVRNGAYTEPPAFNGLSHLYEHMFFKANAAIPSQERYLERQRELGMVWNGTTSDERVNYFFTLGSDNLRDGMTFMRDAIQTPQFLEEELVKERQVVIGELERNLSNPYFHLYRATSEKLWFKYPSRKDTIGDRETISTASIEKMKTVQKKFYIPNNSLLVLAGDVEPEQGFQLAQELFGAWQPGPDPFKADPIPPHPPLPKTEAVIVNKPVQIATASLNLHGPSVGKDPRSTYAADVLSFILAQDNSRFQKNLVDSGLALSANISYYTLNHTGPISISLVARPDKIEEAINALHAELKLLAKPDYFTDEQLQTAKTLLAVEHIYDREKTSAYAHNVSFWWAVAGLDYYLGYLDNLQKVSRDDIKKYVSTYIHKKPYVLGILISQENQAAIGLNDKKAASWAKPLKP